ncbi:MAG TPA: hypothetical protein VFQ43_18360 [Nitrososphaera sp.]|nr:hypothetical protein [Nitrososphaera sp.]
MAILNCLFKAHRLRDDDFGSLMSWVNALHRFSGMWNAQNNKIKDFRACQSFLDHLLDGHVLAALATELGAENWDEFQRKLKDKNWRKLIKMTESKFSESLLVSDWREEPMEKRDLVHENAVLFLQHGLIYRRFTEALRTGDSGWIVICLKHFTIWLNNDDKRTSLPLYRTELINIMACLHYAFSPEAKDYWMNQCMVNMSGSPTGFRACDLVGEYFIREMKRRLRHMLNFENDRFHRTVYAPQVMTAKMVRQHIYEDVGAVEHYQHSSTVKADIDVCHITEALLRERVFTRTSRRHSYDMGNGEAIQQAVDLHGRGVKKLLDGTYLQAYRDKLAKTNGIVEEDWVALVDEILDAEALEDEDAEMEDFY